MEGSRSAGHGTSSTLGLDDAPDLWAGTVSATSIPDACRELVTALASRWDLPSVYLLIDGRLRCMAASGYFQVVDGFTPDTGVIGRSVRTAATVVVEDAHLDPEFVAAIPDLRSEVCAPVVLDGACLGAVSLESREDLPPSAVTEAECAAEVLATTIGRLGGVPPPSMGQRLARMAVGMTAETDTERLRQLTVEGAVEVSGRSSAALSMVDAEGRWETCAVTGPLGSALAGWEQDELALVARWVEAGTSSHFPGGAPVPHEYDFLLRSGVQSIGVQPLVAWGSVMGIIAVADGEPGPHNTQAVANLELFASLAASCLRTAAVLGDLAQRATRDPLTGLRNVSEFRDHLVTACVDSAKSQQASSTCLLIDVDHFKAVNDTHGHQAGDDVLRTLVQVLEAQLRDEDTLYRVGGDEFAAMIGSARADTVRSVAGRLVEAAKSSGTSVSIGSAPVIGTPAAVRAAADEALYAAKHAGRGTHRAGRGA